MTFLDRHSHQHVLVDIGDAMGGHLFHSGLNACLLMMVIFTFVTVLNFAGDLSPIVLTGAFTVVSNFFLHISNQFTFERHSL